jgi:hypothetical protein
MNTLADLEALRDTPALVQVANEQDERKGTVVSVTVTTDMPSETIPTALRVAVDRSLFTVRLANGTLLENVPGRHLAFPALPMPTVRL